MKRILTMLFTLIATLCLALGLTACGGNGGNSGNNMADSGSQTEQPGEGSGAQGGEQNPDEGNQGGTQKPDEGGQGGTADPHTHQFSSAWSSNDATHWHAATCGHSEKKDEAAHTYQNGVCTTCNHAHVAHSFGSYTADDSEHTKTCTVCHKAEASSHTYQNGVCTTCNHAHENHVYGDWVDDIPASETAMGSRHKDCACGKRVTEQTPMITAFEFEQSGNGYAVTAYTGSLTELVVPAEHEGKPVTAIASKAFYDGEFTSITLPASLKEIGESAFGYCTKLQNVEIPNCARIGDSAFIGCDALREVTLPADTILLGSSLFQYCSALKKVTMNGGTVQSTTFANAETVEEIVLAEGIKSVAQNAFADCKNLKKLTLPRLDTTSSFMRYYFGVTPSSYSLYRTEDGSEISDLYPDEVVSHQYGNHIFSLPKDYTDWYYDGEPIEVDGVVYTYDEKPVSVSSWKQYYDVTANAYWYGPKSWSATFYYSSKTSLEKLTITNQLISVYDKIFEDCACDIDIWEKFPITEISVIGASDCYIDFAEEDYRLRVEYEDHFKEDFPLFDHISAADQAALRTVGEHEITATYQGKSCTATINVMLHTFYEAVLESAECIYDGSTFSLEVTGAPEGTDIAYTGNGQSEVGEYTVTATLTKQYYETKTLTATLNILKQRYEIVYNFGLKNVANDNPSDYITNGENIKLNDPVRPGWEFLGWYTEAAFQNIITEIKGNAHKDYTLYAKWQTVFTLSSDQITGLTEYGKKQTELVIDESINGKKITSIGEKAFYQNEKLQKITIGNSVTSIGDDAFEGCSGLTSVTIGSGVTSIGSYAFFGCSGLKEVHISDLAAWCRIGFGGKDANPLCHARHLYVGEAELKDLTIPSEVKEINNYAFYNCDGLTSIEIPDSVTSIGYYAFYDCDGLTSIEIPDSVTSIGMDAFSYCSGLTSVTIGSSVTSIVEYAFYDCSGLEQFIVDEDNTTYSSQDGVLYNKGKTKIVKVPSAIKGAVTIPDSMTSIGDSEFRNCSGLTSVTIGSSVTSIGDYAFSYCSGLEQFIVDEDNTTYSSQDGVLYNKEKTKIVEVPLAIKGAVTIPDGVTEIGDSAFYNCSGLTSVTIGSGVTSIGNGAFCDCRGLTSVIWNAENCTEAGSYSSYNNADYTIFRNCTNLNAVTFGENVKKIPEYAFYNCSKLMGELKIPDSVTSIGIGAFEDCSGLKSVTIGSSVTSIESSAFSGCSKLTSITIPDSVHRIGWSVFHGCSKLTSITIPDSVTSIGMDAFSDTAYYNDASHWDANGVLYIGNHLIEAKKTISGAYTVRQGTKTIAERAFYNCTKLISIIIPDSVTSIMEYAFWYCSGLTSVTIGSGVTSIGESAFSHCSGLTGELKIPDSVTSIGSSAFYSCDGLMSVTIGSGVTSIGARAFYSCDGLTSVTIGSGVTEIGSGAFEDCGGLTGELKIPDSVTSIGSYAFSGCGGLTSVTIGSGVTEIGYEAFYGCSGLTSVTIGSGVTSIGSYAFSNCSGLTKIQYNGTIAAWKQIKKGYVWNYVTGSYTVYCTDGTITKDGTETYSNNAQSVSAPAAPVTATSATVATPRKRES